MDGCTCGEGAGGGRDVGVDYVGSEALDVGWAQSEGGVGVDLLAKNLPMVIESDQRSLMVAELIYSDNVWTESVWLVLLRSATRTVRSPFASSPLQRSRSEV